MLLLINEINNCYTVTVTVAVTYAVHNLPLVAELIWMKTWVTMSLRSKVGTISLVHLVLNHRLITLALLTKSDW